MSTYTLSSLPKTLEEMKAMPESSLQIPEATAALTVAALMVYPENKDECIAMLNYLQGPSPVTEFQKQFLADRFRDKDYVPRSYLAGASPENNYTPSGNTVTFQDNPHSSDHLAEGYMTLYPVSGGADSPREIKLRKKASTNQWFLVEQMILSDIRKPVSEDPWA